VVKFYERRSKSGEAEQQAATHTQPITAREQAAIEY
jgi:hypothetical protein